MNSPIVIFSYNRPKHLSKLIDTILNNRINKTHKVYFFCDGPKNLSDINKIKNIKEILKNKKINFSYINYNKKNIGLSKNIIKGITFVLKKHDRCIVLEDDLVLNENCINFMNTMLNKFKKNNTIGSVSAHSYLEEFKNKKKFDFYISKRHSSWCWGTWSNVWNNINWNEMSYTEHFSHKKNIEKFSDGGKDLNLLLWGNYKKYIDSWAIRFNFYCMNAGLKSVQPRFSMIRNEGRDLSGTHEKFTFKIKKKYNFNPKLGQIDNILARTAKNNEIDSYIKNSHRRSIKLSIRYFLKEGKIL
tara:strand:+ start:279 stop:1181 length:903 start_codon:yes stop_codon:yes gene_type:complete